MKKKQYLKPGIYVYHAAVKASLMLGSKTVTNDYGSGSGSGSESGSTPEIHNETIDQGGGIVPANSSGHWDDGVANGDSWNAWNDWG